MVWVKKNKDLLVKVICILGIIFSFIILDLGLRFFLWEKIGFVSYKSFSPLAFSFSYILILLAILFIFNKKAKYIYIIIIMLSNIYLLAQMIHFKILGNFFSLVSLFSAGEGMDYLGYALKCIDFKMIFLMVLSIVSAVITLLIPKKLGVNIFQIKHKLLCFIIIIVSFVLMRVSGIYKLGVPVSNGAWDAWKVPRNIYDNFNNNNRSFMVSGMYEYIFRDIYLYIKQRINPKTKENIKDVNEYISSLDSHIEKNEYTGIFENKNLIIIMMESIDDWLVTDDVMPTLTKLEKTGINFENRYAPFFGGAMTINSEFASVTGLYSLSSEKAIYNYSNNNFDYSLPSMFISNGYTANSIHMNDGEFYNRKNFHKALGFENHYALYNMDISGRFEFDSQIAEVDDSYKLIVPDNKFLTFITTFSAHVPYVDSAMCKELSDKNKQFVEEDNEELRCIKLLANDTDNFIKILLERLEKDNRLDDTVIVLFADHYAYGYSDVENIKGIKDNNLIQKTPLIIWSKDLTYTSVETMIDTADITPTLLNMFNINYDPRLYMGTDVFSESHENFVYFSDYSWYDGEIYSKTIDEANEYTKKVSTIVNKKIDINRKIISSNFYKYYEE